MIRDPSAEHLATIGEALRCTLRQELEQRPILSTGEALINYLLFETANLEVEEVRVLFLNGRNYLLADEAVSRGTVDGAFIYPREIIKRALELGSTALILVHNHPSGDPTPSDNDVSATKRLADAGRELQIAVHDHLVVASSGWISMRSEGLL